MWPVNACGGPSFIETFPENMADRQNWSYITTCMPAAVKPVTFYLLDLAVKNRHIHVTMSRSYNASPLSAHCMLVFPPHAPHPSVVGMPRQLCTHRQGLLHRHLHGQHGPWAKWKKGKKENMESKHDFTLITSSLPTAPKPKHSPTTITIATPCPI